MSEVKTDLARIKGAWIGREDHGILTSYLDLEYGEPGHKLGSTGQGFGGYGLGGPYLAAWVEGCLAAVGVDRWDRLEGCWVWAEHEHTKVHAITGVVTNFTFRPEETWKLLEAAK